MFSERSLWIEKVKFEAVGNDLPSFNSSTDVARMCGSELGLKRIGLMDSKCITIVDVS